MRACVCVCVQFDFRLSSESGSQGLDYQAGFICGFQRGLQPVIIFTNCSCVDQFFNFDFLTVPGKSLL